MYKKYIGLSLSLEVRAKHMLVPRDAMEHPWQNTFVNQKARALGYLSFLIFVSSVMVCKNYKISVKKRNRRQCIPHASLFVFLICRAPISLTAYRRSAYYLESEEEADDYLGAATFAVNCSAG